MKQARSDAAQQIEKYVSDVAVEIFDVIAEDPKEKHVAQDVRNARMQKHTGQQGQERCFKGRVAGKPSRESGGDGSVRHHEDLEGVRREEELVNEHDEVGHN